MPKLPDATNLTGVNIGAPRSMVDIGVPDYIAASNVVARGVQDVGNAAVTIMDERRKKFAAQERFDTKMGLLKAEEAYNERVKDLDPLDPDYVEKKKAAKKEVYGSVLSNVKDPENRQFFDLSTYEDFISTGLTAEKEHKKARGQKQAIDLDNYVDEVRKRVRDKNYTGDPEADITQMVNDSTDIDEVTRQTILPKYLSAINGDQFEVEFGTIATGGVSVTPSVRSAVTKAIANAGPNAPSWLGDYLLRTAMIESRGGRAKVNKENPQVAGTWQIDDDTAPELGLSLKDRFDDEKAAVGITKMALRDYRVMKAALGREPTPAELYLAHQQGIGGGPKLLANPDKKAVDVVGKKAVEQNLPKNMRDQAATMTAGQFAKYVMSQFDGNTGGIIDPNDTLETLRLTDSYQKMSADEQAAAEKDVLARIDKQNKEAEKDIQLNIARDYANQAASTFMTLSEGNLWIDENISDPETREKARTMYKAEFEASEKKIEAEYKEFLSTATANVMNAVNSGDTQAALKAIPAEGLDPEDYEKLLERVSKGPVQFDDSKILDQLRYMKYSDSEKYKDLNLMDYAPFLKRSTVDGLIADQEKIRKGLEKTGKMPSLEARSKLLNETYDILGLDTSTKVSDTARQANARTQQRIASIFETNVQMAVDLAGRELQPEELRRVRDETLLEFTRKEQKSGLTTNYEIAIQQGLPDVFTLFDEQEAKINAAIEAENQKRIAAGQPVENLRSPGSLLRQAQEELATLNTAERRRVSDEIKAIERGLRSPGPGVRDNAINERYTRLQRERRALEEFEINAQTLYEWLAVTFAPQDRNAE